jgi:hypothetical protein
MTDKYAERQTITKVVGERLSDREAELAQNMRATHKYMRRRHVEDFEYASYMS